MSNQVVKLVVRGCIAVQTIGEVTRTFVNGVIPFGQLREYLSLDLYSIKTGKGNQRTNTETKKDGSIVYDSWSRKLWQIMQTPDYVPTSFHLTGVERKQINDNGNGIVTIELNQGETICNINSGHRCGALEHGLAQVRAVDTVENKKLEEQILAFPCPIVFLMDGDRQRDFLALQAGKKVDSSIQQSLLIATEQLSAEKLPSATLGERVVVALNSAGGKNINPLSKQVKCDPTSTSRLSTATLNALGSSDLTTSFVGYAKIAIASDKGQKAIVENYVEHASELLAEFPIINEPGDKKLCFVQPPNMPLAGATMFTMQSMMRSWAQWNNIFDDKDELLESWKHACSKVLQENMAGDFTSPRKRKLSGEFARTMFAKANCRKHEGIPVELMECLTVSSFGATAIPEHLKTKEETQEGATTTGKKRGRPAKKQEETAGATS